ncbi:MAG: hypothetical protein U0V87_07980 [Acidobacteriota bacterium]
MEQPQNGSFFAKYELSSIPEMLVIDPSREVALASHIGSLAVVQVQQFLDDGARAFSNKHQDPDQATFTEATALMARGDTRLAAERLTMRCLPRCPRRRWGRASGEAGVVAELTRALSESGNTTECISVARREAESLRGTPAFGKVATTGLGCALSSEHQEEAAKQFAARMAEAFEQTELLPIDRSYLLSDLTQYFQIIGDEPARQRVARQWLEYLETVTGRENASEPRESLDNELMRAAQTAGVPARAVAALERTAALFPASFATKTRLAQLYAATKQWDRGLALVTATLPGLTGFNAFQLRVGEFDLYLGKGTWRVRAAACKQRETCSIRSRRPAVAPSSRYPFKLARSHCRRGNSRSTRSRSHTLGLGGVDEIPRIGCFCSFPGQGDMRSGSGAPLGSACEPLEHADVFPPTAVLPQSAMSLASGHRSLRLALSIARHTTRKAKPTRSAHVLLLRLSSLVLRCNLHNRLLEEEDRHPDQGLPPDHGRPSAAPSGSHSRRGGRHHQTRRAAVGRQSLLIHQRQERALTGT